MCIIRILISRQLQIKTGIQSNMEIPICVRIWMQMEPHCTSDTHVDLGVNANSLQ